MKPIGTPLNGGEGMAEVLDRRAVFAFGYHWVADEEEVAEQIEFARRLLSLPVGSLVLMPFCGAGWHAHELAMWGYQVVGIDPCQKLVEEALERNHKMGISAMFAVAEAPLPFREASFDAAMILGTRFGLTGSEQDDRRWLAELARVLKPNGRLVLELPHRDGIVRNWQERTWERLHDGAACLIVREWDALMGQMLEEWTVMDADGQTLRFAFTCRIYTPTELAVLLQTHGFEMTNAFGTFLGAELALHHRRMIIQAIRQ
jgi:D-alanine-D-alanine ligase